MVAGVGIIAPPAHPHHLPQGCEQVITAKQSQPFIERVWDKHRWERGSPGSPALRAWRHKLHCAGPRNQKAMKRHWRGAKRSYYEHRDRKRHPWRYAFEALSEADQAWAISTGDCESGNNPTTDTGNGFEGAFQWEPSTWAAAGGSGRAVDASWHEQAVRAVRWRNIAGATQWPVCGV